MKKRQNKVHIDIPREKVVEFCQRNHIHKFALFGSVLRKDLHLNSDIDVLVEFEPEHVPGLAFFSMEAELSDMLGRKVDLNTPNFLSPYFRNEVLAEAEVFYVKE
ncbi:MAG: nucleotidyltransferase family protein [Thermodesulfobacteriota bacterium]